MSEQFLIDDGYTIDGKIPRAIGIHPELRFTFRPALSAERYAYMKASQETDKRHKVDAAMIVAHVSSWNVRGKNGNEIDKPTQAIAEKLNPTLSGRLIDVIMSYAASGEEDNDAKN